MTNALPVLPPDVQTVVNSLPPAWQHWLILAAALFLAIEKLWPGVFTKFTGAHKGTVDHLDSLVAQYGPETVKALVEALAKQQAAPPTTPPNQPPAVQPPQK